MTISIIGLTSTYKVPGFYAEVVYGAGPISAGDIPLVLLVVGLKSSAGSITADTQVVDIFSTTDADTYAGPGSEGACMLYQALSEPGVQVKYASPAAAGGAVQATATITIVSTPPHAATGEYTIRIDGKPVSIVIATTDAQNTIATNLAAAINAQPQLPVTAAPVANVVTLTVKSPGIRGNQYILFENDTGVPSTVTTTIAGGASVTGGGVYFTGGAGTESVTNLLTTLEPNRYHRIAFAQNDATNGALWETFLNTQAGVLVGIRQHGICAVNDTYANAVSLAQTTFNTERVQVLWLKYSESHPSELAARFMARRTVVEQSDPDAMYDGFVMTGIAPQSQASDWPTTTVQNNALNNSVTPLTTNSNGDVVVVRSITTKSLTSGNPDYRTLDTSQAVVPDYVADQLQLLWLTEFLPANPRVAPDPPATQKEAIPGIATPTRWQQRITKLLKDDEAGVNLPLPILIDVDNNPAVVEYDAVAKRLMAIVPVVPAPGNHQTGASVRQVG